jgi:hypothetical protein
VVEMLFPSGRFLMKLGLHAVWIDALLQSAILLARAVPAPLKFDCLVMKLGSSQWRVIHISSVLYQIPLSVWLACILWQ